MTDGTSLYRIQNRAGNCAWSCSIGSARRLGILQARCSILPRGIEIPDPWGPISRSTNVSRLERDRGWRVVQNRYPVALEPDAVRNLRGFAACVAWGSWSQTRRLGDQSGWTRRRRLGRAGACGNVTGRLNRHCQCEFEPASAPRNAPHLPGLLAPRSPLPAPRSSLLAPRSSLLAWEGRGVAAGAQRV